MSPTTTETSYAEQVRLARLATRSNDPETVARIEDVLAERRDRESEQLARLAEQSVETGERLSAIETMQAHVPAPTADSQHRDHLLAVRDSLLERMRGTGDGIINLASVTTGVDSGALFPHEVLPSQQIRAEGNVFRRVPGVNVYSMTDNSRVVDVPIINNYAADTPERDENAAVAEKAPTPTHISIPVTNYSGYADFTREFFVGAGPQLMQQVVDGLYGGSENAFRAGITTKASVGMLAKLPLGATAANPGAITEENIEDIFYAITAGYEDGIVWMMRRPTEPKLRVKINETERATTPRGTLLGVDVLYNSSVPAPGANKDIAVVFNGMSLYIREVPQLDELVVDRITQAVASGSIRIVLNVSLGFAWHVPTSPVYGQRLRVTAAS